MQHKFAELARAGCLHIKTQLTQEEKNTHKGASKLKNIPQTTGFRRYFISQLVNSELQTEQRWLLEGHNLKANYNSYVYINKKELHRSQKLTHDNLLIDQSLMLMKRVQNLEI